MKVTTFKVSSYFIENQCYLVEKNKECILIDPAWNFDLIKNYILHHQLKLKGVLLTHSHIDHTNLADKFATEYNIPIYIGKKEAEFFEFKCNNLMFVSHLDKINIGSFLVHSLLTPGHTIGSICYLIENHIFSGDTVFIEGVGGCYDKSSNPENLYYSIQYLKNYLPSSTVFWPGHSYGVQPGKDLSYLLKNNIYFQIDTIDHFVSFRMRKKQAITF